MDQKNWTQFLALTHNPGAGRLGFGSQLHHFNPCNLGQLLNLTGPQFPNLQNGDNSGIYFIGLLGELNELIQVDPVEHTWQMASKCNGVTW